MNLCNQILYLHFNFVNLELLFIPIDVAMGVIGQIFTSIAGKLNQLWNNIRTPEIAKSQRLTHLVGLSAFLHIDICFEILAFALKLESFCIR